MSKLMRGLVLGAMLAVLSSATAVAATQPPDNRTDAVQQFRAGERASAGQLTLSQPIAEQPAQPIAEQPAQPSGQGDMPVALLAFLAAAAVLSLGLDAMLVRRKARKASASTAI